MRHAAGRRSSAYFSEGKEERTQDMSTHPRQQILTHTPAAYTSDELDEREVERQLFLFHQLNQVLGGPVPAGLVDLARVSTVLDVFCGAGGWTLDLACDYPHLQITGIDASERALASARRLAQEGGFTNASFCSQDLCCPPALLDNLPGAPFDLIHTAFLAPRILRMEYPALLQVFWQLCRPGGLLCWTELEFPLTTSPALEQLICLICQALTPAGQSGTFPPRQASAALFVPAQERRGVAKPSIECCHRGLSTILGSWFQQAGYQQVRRVPTVIDISFESEAYDCFTQQVEAFLGRIRPFLQAQEVITPEALETLALQVESEVRQEGFCGHCWLLSVLGQKPEAAHTSPH